MTDILTQLQTWFEKQCDGEWEHQNGMLIETLDNPGWKVEIDLNSSTGDEIITIEDWERDENNWVNIQLRDGKYIGNGGPQNLNEILFIFISRFILPVNEQDG